jgi:hypothetical protein
MLPFTFGIYVKQKRKKLVLKANEEAVPKIHQGVLELLAVSSEDTNSQDSESAAPEEAPKMPAQRGMICFYSYFHSCFLSLFLLSGKPNSKEH